jgi:hypothetical protein
MIVSHLYYDNGVKAIKMIRNDFATKYNQRPGLKESKDDIDNLLGKWPRLWLSRSSASLSTLVEQRG